MKISELLTEEYIKKFRVFHELTLFPPDWELLKQKRCPICGLKLKFPLWKDIVYCSSKKHKRVFVIAKDTMNKLT